MKKILMTRLSVCSLGVSCNEMIDTPMLLVVILTCAVYSNIHYSPLCIAGQLSCILRLECKHIITETHTKFTRAI